ncbi:MAG: SUMF1/EgtB/PvdO family nonheme iron enzyme [Saprospiraceae bacterium]|nr:SUMF1/EgtB/PvdO family nonheme iron enzyme [Saprospiraceae bacterium]
MNTEILPVSIFIAYSSKDLAYKDEIRKRLRPLERAKKVQMWDNYNIEAGTDWNADIHEKLHQADLILLLLSPDALDSDYFYEVEAPIALERHKAGEALAVGILLRPCNLKYTPFEFEQYELLPKKGIPVTDPHWTDVDSAYLTIYEEIDLLVMKIETARQAKKERQEKVEQDNARIGAAETAPPPPKLKIISAAKAGRMFQDPFADLMVPIKGGAFDMGDTFDDGDNREKPVHRVNVKDFYLCKYPVTQGQWAAVMRNNPAHFQGDEYLPVEQVSWNDAQDFIERLNLLTNKKYRLPSEAEWEYAAREGGKKIRFGNGRDVADPIAMNFNADKEYKKPYSVVGEYRGKTTTVGTFLPNALGLYDMSGNVWEWCQDAHHNDYMGAPDDGSVWEIRGNRSSRLVRGGSWFGDSDLCRAAQRDWYINDGCNDIVGFRLAL